jgi:hypothetical protein
MRTRALLKSTVLGYRQAGFNRYRQMQGKASPFGTGGEMDTATVRFNNRFAQPQTNTHA